MEPVIFFFGGWEPILRIVVVGTLGYVALLLLLRLAGKRTLARMSAFDFIITITLGAAFGRILTTKSVSLAEAVTAFAVLVALQYVAAWLKLHSPVFAHMLDTPPSLLYFRGEFLRETMRREQVSETEIESVLREHGVGSLEQVEAIVFQSNGSFAVVKAGQAGDGSTLRRMMGS